MPILISRQDARTAGLKRYFTGRPCPYGHISERFVSTLACVDCARDRKREWAKTNLAKTSEYSRQWVAKNAEKSRAVKRAWNAANPEGQKARSRKWYLANKAKADEAHKRWALRNPGRVNALAAKRRADELLRTPLWADHDEIDAIYVKARELRESGLKVEVDHVIPLRGKRVSGLHVAENMQIIPSDLNKRKSNQFLEN